MQHEELKVNMHLYETDLDAARIFNSVTCQQSGFFSEIHGSALNRKISFITTLL